MEDQAPPVRYAVEAGIARLTLDRPEKRNAFDGAMIARLNDHLARAAADPDLRLLILQASGRHFSAGADLGWMRETARMSEAENREDARHLSELMDRLDRLPCPTIARVQGAAFGGALGLICCCDMAIGSDEARFCLSEVRLGLSPAVISPYVVRAMGVRQARRYMLSAEVFSAADAVRLGVLHEQLPDDELDERILQLAQALGQAGPEASRATKALIRRVDEDFPERALREYAAELIARLRTGPEGQEGLAAFFDKRAPAWREDNS